MSIQGNLLASGSLDNSVQVTDMHKVLQLFEFKHENSVTCVKFNGKQLITGSRDGTVRIWDLVTGKQVDQVISTSKCQHFDLRLRTFIILF